jgi:ABC-2 type transport system permease protein
MPRASIFLKAMRDLRWQVFWYGVGLASMCALVVFVYPSYRDQLASFEIPDALKPLIGDANYASGAGFLTAEFFSWGPLLGVIFAIMAGTSALGGEEAAGTLDLLLSQPISRRRLILEKMAGFAVGACLTAAIVDLGWLLSVPFVEIDVSLSTLLAATFLMVPQMLLVGAIAIWASAFLPDRKLATGFVTGVVVVSFFVNYLAELVDVLAPLRRASFFSYQNNEVLTKGLDILDLAVLLLAAGTFALLATLAFERREIGVHGGGVTLPRLFPRRHSEARLKAPRTEQGPAAL